MFINYSLEMPVEPTDKNFKKFEQENPFIHLNVYTPAVDEEKCDITPLYVGMNQSTKIVNILYYKNEQTTTMSSSTTSADSFTMLQSATTGSLSALTALAIL